MQKGKIMDINKNLNVTDFVLSDEKYNSVCAQFFGDDTDISAPQPVEREEKEKNVPSASTLYEAVVQSGPDFVIRRKDKRTVRDFACIISKDLYYIEENGKRTEADEAGIREFLLKLPEDGFELPDVTWISRLFSGKGFAEDFCTCLRSSKYKEMAKKGLFYIYGKDQYKWRSSYEAKKDRLDFSRDYADLYSEYNIMHLKNLDDLEKILSWCVKYLVKRGSTIKQALMFLSGQYGTNLCPTIGSMYSIKEAFGLDAMHQFFEGIYETERFYCLTCVDQRGLKNKGGLYQMWPSNAKILRAPLSMDSLLSYNMKPSAFAEYASYGLANYGRASSRFFSEWSDCLAMQIQLFGKIKEKYPVDLVTYHDQLSEAIVRYKAEIDLDEWKAVSENWSKFEGIYGDYVIIAPKTPEALYDEAVQQCNCLASYAKRVSHGEDMIFFLRRKADPNVSVITIELHPDLTIGQVYGLRNRDPEACELNAVRAWAEDKGLYLPVIPEPEHG